MAIRSSVKTIVIKENTIFLVKYISESGFVHYELPGGGQNQFEEMEDAAKREFFEETGLRMKINRFAAIAEEIFEDEDLREHYPNYVHRIHHIFQADIISNEIEKSLENDVNQVGCEWIPINKISELCLIPKQLKDNLNKILSANHPIYLGTGYEKIDLK